jgi:hypothetical protein
MTGDQKNGIPAMKWGGSDIDKFNALAHTFVATIQNAIPEIKDVYYDHDKHGFYSRSSGESFSQDAFGTTARDSSAARAIRAGESSLRRAVFLQSLMDSESKGIGERTRVLEAIQANRLSADERGVKQLFSRAAPQKRPCKT